MGGLKVKTLIALIFLVGGTATALGVVLARGDAGTSNAEAGARIAAQLNSGSQAAKVVKVLKCLKGKDGTSFLCALVVTPDGQAVACALGAATVTPKAVKITSFNQADPTVCYFAT